MPAHAPGHAEVPCAGRVRMPHRPPSPEENTHSHECTTMLVAQLEWVCEDNLRGPHEIGPPKTVGDCSAGPDV